MIKQLKQARFNQVEKISHRPGLYSWHLYFKEGTDIREYNSIYSEKDYQADITGNLGEKISGTLNTEKNIKSDGLTKEKLFSTLTKKLAPPLYIGISNNLKRRLSEHATQLNLIVHGADIESTDGIKSSDLDSDIESRYFANRLGKTMKELYSIGLNNLVVKFAEFDDYISRDDLLEIEYYLNRVYKPIYGRN